MCGMSDRAREVVRYIKAVERGPEYTIIRPPHPPYYEFMGPPQNKDWERARWMDLLDPLVNARAVIRMPRQAGWKTYMTRRYREYLNADAD